MSQVTHPAHPKVQFGAQLRAHRRLVLAALLALLATAGVVLALALSENQSTTTVSDQPAPAVRGDGGPEETAVAASVGSRSAGRPDESTVAAAIGAGPARSRPSRPPRPAAPTRAAWPPQSPAADLQRRIPDTRRRLPAGASSFRGRRRSRSPGRRGRPLGRTNPKSLQHLEAN